MSIRCSSTSPKVRRSGDCGGHLSTVNGHVQETSLRGSGVVNRKTVLLESFIKRVGRGQRQYSGWLLCLTNAPLVLRRTKWENIPQTTSFDDTCELQPQFPGLSWQEQHLMLSSAAVVHLLQGSTCCAFIDAFLHTLVATSGYLSYCWRTFSSKLCGHSLISGINKTFLPRDVPLTSYFLFFGYFSYQSPKSPFLLYLMVGSNELRWSTHQSGWWVTCKFHVCKLSPLLLSRVFFFQKRLKTSGKIISLLRNVHGVQEPCRRVKNHLNTAAGHAVKNISSRIKRMSSNIIKTSIWLKKDHYFMSISSISVLMWVLG